METTTPTRSDASSPAATTGRARWPYAGPGQAQLLLASLVIAIGSFLPWVDTAVGTFTGMAGPGAWTFYAAVVGIAGAMVRPRGLVVAHAVVVGCAAVGLAVWQLLRLVPLCSGGACIPSTGLFLVLGAGIWALLQVPRLRAA